jgi:hypothetical protein
MNDIKLYIEEIAALLPLNKSISYVDAEKRAAAFLVAQAKIADYKHLLSGEKIRLLSIQTATYVDEMSKQDNKTVTEKKLNAEASEAYITAREDLEYIENDISYLKSYAEIFKDAHVFYRQMARGES